ncbi:MAG: ABC transporter permease [Candidatus Sumerlaeales bacterium]|nr:ABC transporter permease [Candidatus Sumerlaeales bacterium]
MNKVLAVALNTFREAVRNKILYFLLLFSMLIIGFSTFLSDLSINEAQNKLIKDIGLSSIDFIGFLIAVLVGINLIYNEIERRTIYTIVSKPIDRPQFIWGKYIGLLITVYVNVLIMSIVFFSVLYFRDSTAPDAIQKHFQDAGETVTSSSFAYYWFHVKALFISAGKGIATIFGYSEQITHHLMRVVGMSMISLAVITAFAILYSTFATPTLSAVYTFLTFIIGTMCNDIVRYADTIAKNANGVENLVGVAYLKYKLVWLGALLVPNLELFNKRRDAVYGMWDVMENPIPNVPIDGVTIAYGIVYAIGVMCLACLVFNRRNFK